MESYDLIKIKDKYGEKMMHLCRSLFPTLLDTEGLLFYLMSSNFAYSKYLYDDIVNNNKVEQFRTYINGKILGPHRVIESFKTPKELLSEKGYTLYECKTEEEVQSFKKYYAKGEELCTFRWERLKRSYVFFAVKDNADKLNRDDYLKPSREDEYGVSVLSIQFTRGKKNALSIMNRYNHTVKNSDATYFNNLDNIAAGLTSSFEKTYNLDISNNNSGNLDIPNYVKTKNGKYYRYNYKIDNIYYCPDNIIIVNNHVINYYNVEKEKYLIIDYFIIDMENKTISLYDESITDSFIDGLKDIYKIEIVNDKDTETKYIYITQKENIIRIAVDKYNRIIGYHNEYLSHIGNNFLMYNDMIKEVYLPNVKFIADNFLYFNNNMEKLYAPELTEIGWNFLYTNRTLTELYVPKLKYVDSYCLFNNNLLANKPEKRKKKRLIKRRIH